MPTRDERELAAIETEIYKAGRVIDKWFEAQEARIFMLRCTCATYQNSPWNVWGHHQCVDVPPAIFQDGWGYFRVFTFEEERTRDLFRDLNKLGPTELIRKRDIPLNFVPSSVWANSLFSDLTGNQMDALLKAHRYGCYNSPRGVTTDSIARSLSVSRSTYEEHLRKAENRIMASLIPYCSSSQRPRSDPNLSSNGRRPLSTLRLRRPPPNAFMPGVGSRVVPRAGWRPSRRRSVPKAVAGHCLFAR